jgi:hypothetical protein
VGQSLGGDFRADRRITRLAVSIDAVRGIATHHCPPSFLLMAPLHRRQAILRDGRCTVSILSRDGLECGDATLDEVVRVSGELEGRVSH